MSVNDADNTPASTTAKVTPPTLPNNFPWDNYKLIVCKKGTTTCLNFNCAAATINACPLTGLAPTTLYTVTVVAQRSGYPDSPCQQHRRVHDPFPILPNACVLCLQCAVAVIAVLEDGACVAAAVQHAATCVPLVADEATCGTACIPSNTCCATDNAQGFQCKYSIGETCPSGGANCVAARE